MATPKSQQDKRHIKLTVFSQPTLAGLSHKEAYILEIPSEDPDKPPTKIYVGLDSLAEMIGQSTLTATKKFKASTTWSTITTEVYELEDLETAGEKTWDIKKAVAGTTFGMGYGKSLYELSHAEISTSKHGVSFKSKDWEIFLARSTKPASKVAISDQQKNELQIVLIQYSCFQLLKEAKKALGDKSSDEYRQLEFACHNLLDNIANSEKRDQAFSQLKLASEDFIKSYPNKKVLDHYLATQNIFYKIFYFFYLGTEFRHAVKTAQIEDDFFKQMEGVPKQDKITPTKQGEEVQPTEAFYDKEHDDANAVVVKPYPF